MVRCVHRRLILDPGHDPHVSSERGWTQSPPGGCQLERTLSPEYSLNRLPRMGVLGNGNNLSHGTSPQVPSTGRRTRVDRTRRLAQVPWYSKANGNGVK
ncbi:hypothetical protein Taro_000964 [Colocasia esculenta]|uniref:Uncharacterized protein n=1 Tax=Colocasia esculenta TaxID=4460 RepID=A0A843THV9_COLES|nr:hypothetical protein [Colocasia esculenta]